MRNSQVRAQKPKIKSEDQAMAAAVPGTAKAPLLSGGVSELEGVSLGGGLFLVRTL
jgi:hypothetical protein